AARGTHAEYVDIVKEAWSQGTGNVPRCITCVREESIMFNKLKFGNFFMEKR
ncbi:hypothetical protein SESBI_42688, partial [Sesbania bispinosa]